MQQVQLVCQRVPVQQSAQAQWECACQERHKWQLEKWMRAYKCHGKKLHTFLVPNFAVPIFTCSKSPLPGLVSKADIGMKRPLFDPHPYRLVVRIFTVSSPSRMQSREFTSNVWLSRTRQLLYDLRNTPKPDM